MRKRLAVAAAVLAVGVGFFVYQHRRDAAEAAAVKRAQMMGACLSIPGGYRAECDRQIDAGTLQAAIQKEIDEKLKPAPQAYVAKKQECDRLAAKSRAPEKEPEPEATRTFILAADCGLELMRLGQDFHRDLGILMARQNAAGFEPTTSEVARAFEKALSP